MIEPPLESDDPTELLNWLELIALFSVEKVAHLDIMVNAVEIADDQHAEDIATADVECEALIESIPSGTVSGDNDGATKAGRKPLLSVPSFSGASSSPGGNPCSDHPSLDLVR